MFRANLESNSFNSQIHEVLSRTVFKLLTHCLPRPDKPPDTRRGGRGVWSSAASVLAHKVVRSAQQFLVYSYIGLQCMSGKCGGVVLAFHPSYDRPALPTRGAGRVSLVVRTVQ